MNTIEKIKILGMGSYYDKCGTNAGCKPIKNKIRDEYAHAIYKASGGNGKRSICLFKILQSNACSYDCKYCANSTCSERKAVSLEPEEIASTFARLERQGYVEGLFLSSGVIGDVDKTTEKMLETVRIVRNKYNYEGYIHFKILPGTNYELVKQAAELSNRLSVNIETPSKSRLAEVSDVKDFKIDILRRQAWISKMNLKSGQTTQLVVGASGENDLEILKMMKWEYDAFNLKRVHFSSFSPVKGTAFENKNKVDPLREHRLYNIDFMLRRYDSAFSLNEFREIMTDGFLPREDPKLALAKAAFEKPVEINDASYKELLKIPGIGPKTAFKIIKKRKKQRIKKRADLKEAGVILNRAMPFIKIDGNHQKMISSF